MGHRDESTGSKKGLRALSGVLAAGGLLAVGSSVFRWFVNGSGDWGSLALLVGAAYGVYLFGHYAVTGRLALKFPDSTGPH